MPFPSGPAHNQRFTAEGRTWRWDATLGLWQPFVGGDLNASSLPIHTIPNVNATNTQQALQQLFERTVTPGPPEPIGTIPQGPAGPTTSITGDPALFMYPAGPWRRYVDGDTPLQYDRTDVPMPPGWSAGMSRPTLMTDSTARMGPGVEWPPGTSWYNVAVHGIQTHENSNVYRPAGPFTIGVWALNRPGGQKRFADIWLYGGDEYHVQFIWDTVDATTEQHPPNVRPTLLPGGTGLASQGGTTVNAYGVYRMPNGWTFGWMQVTRSIYINGMSTCLADRWTNGTPGMQFWPGSPTTSGIYWWRHYCVAGHVSVPNLLG